MWDEKGMPETKFQFQWWPYFLATNLPVDGISKLDSYRSKYKGNEKAVQSMVKKIKSEGSKDGLNFSYGACTQTRGVQERAHPLWFNTSPFCAQAER